MFSIEMCVIKISALVLIFVTGVILAPLLTDVFHNYGKGRYIKFLGTILKKILQIRNLFKNRSRKFEEQLVGGLDLLSNSLKSGFSLFQGLGLLSKEMPPPISEEFQLVLQEMKLGHPLELALQNLTKRMKSEELDIVITVIEISQETGGSLSEALSRVAYTIRERNKIIGKMKSLTSQGRMQAIIVGLLPVFLCIAILGVDPRFIMPLFSQPLGWIMLGIAGGMEITGMIVIRKIMSIDV